MPCSLSDQENEYIHLGGTQQEMNQLMKAHEVEDQDEVSERRAKREGHKSPDHMTRSKKSE